MQHRAVNPNPAGRWRRPYLFIAAAVLITPLVAMQFTDQVAWGPGDFTAAAVLLATAWLGLELTWRFARSGRTRTVASSVIVLALLAIWAHLAVGLWK